MPNLTLTLVCPDCGEVFTFSLARCRPDEVDGECPYCESTLVEPDDDGLGEEEFWEGMRG